MEMTQRMMRRVVRGPFRCFMAVRWISVLRGDVVATEPGVPVVEAKCHVGEYLDTIE